jgi:exopolyphosphatase/guanosine-5'-triphosphate,3'-diphosphate pyrophosphatase
VRSPTPIFNEKGLVRPGRQVGSTGLWARRLLSWHSEALGRFKVITRILGVRTRWAIATAACRDA